MSVVVNKDRCRGCAICTAQCPVGAISMIERVAVIDNNKCVECLRCIEVCPTEAISQITDTQKISVADSKEPIKKPINNDLPNKKQPFWTPERKRQAAAIGGTILGGLGKAAGELFRNRRRGEGRGRGSGRGQGFGRGRGGGRGRGRR